MIRTRYWDKFSSIFRKGDIVIWSTDTWLGRLVRVVTRSGFNHSVLCLDNGDVLEAEIPKVRVSSVDPLRRQIIKAVLLRYKKYDVDNIFRMNLSNSTDSFVDSVVGKRYDFFQIASLAIFSLVAPWYLYSTSPIPFNFKSLYICSELVCSYYRICLRRDLFDGKRSEGSVQPSMFLESTNLELVAVYER